MTPINPPNNVIQSMTPRDSLTQILSLLQVGHIIKHHDTDEGTLVLTRQKLSTDRWIRNYSDDIECVAIPLLNEGYTIMLSSHGKLFYLKEAWQDEDSD